MDFLISNTHINPFYLVGIGFLVRMLGGFFGGVEVGAQLIQFLKHRAHIDLVVGIAFIVVLLSISTFMAVESWKTFQLNRKKPARTPKKGDTSVTKPKVASKKDVSAFGYIAK